MSTTPQSALTLDNAEKILHSFSCLETKSIDSPAAKESLRQSLFLITDFCDYQNFGICADSTTQGFSTLKSYLQALGYDDQIDTSEIPTLEGSVYIKFNTKKRSFYLDSYQGKYRGVLVSCQSEEYQSLNNTYGHLPLDLFED